MAAWLGIDWGEKRVGIAMGEARNRRARGLVTLDGTNPKLLDHIRQLCQEHQVTQLVMGLPRGLDGQETAQTAQSRKIAELWSQSLELPVALQDEAVTSELARERLGRRVVAADKGAIDREAAAIILQDYLDAEVV